MVKKLREAFCYALIIFVFVMLKRGFQRVPAFWRTFNIIPFTGYFNQGYGVHYFTTIFLGQMFIKLILFMPLGIYLRYKNMSLKQTALLILLSSTMTDAIKLITGFGAFDSTDLLLNTLGALIAYVGFSALLSKMPDHQHDRLTQKS